MRPSEPETADDPKPTEAIPADVAVRYIRELPETWRKADGGPGRQLLASVLFSRIEVLGIREATVHLSAHAVRHGLAAAIPAELGILVNGRGERIRTSDLLNPIQVRYQTALRPDGGKSTSGGSSDSLRLIAE